MTNLPRAVSTDQEFYAHHSAQLERVADLIAEQNELLRQTLTARPADQSATTNQDEPGDGPRPVQLREPEPIPESQPTRTARGGRRTTKASK